MADYKIGIEILLADNGEAVLGLLGRRLLGIHGNVEDLEGGFGRLKTAIGGAFAIGGALALLDVMGKLIKKGTELEQTMYELQTIGFTPKEMAAVKANATQVAGKYPNLTERDLVKLTGETTAVYGDPAVAMKNLPVAAAYMAALKYRHPNDADGATEIAEDAIFKVLRSEEMRGLAQNPAEVKRALAATLKGQEVFGEQFDPTVSFQAVKYGRLASRYLSDRFLEGPGLILAQELGGSNFGNSVNQVMQAFIGGHMTKSAIREAIDIGLIDPRKVGRPKGSGSQTAFNLAGAIPKTDLLQSDPDIWFNTVFKPIVDKATKGDPAKRDQILRVLMQRTTAQQMAEILGWQTGPGGRITKNVGRLALAMTPDQAVIAAQTNLATSTQNLSTQFDRLKTNLGDPMAKGAGAVAGAVTGPVKAAADASAHHPGASAAVDAGIGAAVVGLGVYGVKTLWGLGKSLLTRLTSGTVEEIAQAAKPAAGVAKVLGSLGGGIRGVGGALGAINYARFGELASGIGLLTAEVAMAVDITKRALVVPKGTIMPWTPGAFGPRQKGHIDPGTGYWIRDSSVFKPPPPALAQVTVNHTTTLDGKTIAKSVTKHLVNAMNGPSTGYSGFDGKMNYSPVSVPAGT